MSEENLSAALSLSLLAMLAFDNENAALIRNSIEAEDFSGVVHRHIAGQLYAYIDQYGKPAGDHLPDLFEEDVEDERQGSLYQQQIDAIIDVRTNYNAGYVLNKLEEWTRRQRLSKGVRAAFKLIDAGSMSEAENVLEDALRRRLVAFDPGLTLPEVLKGMKSLEQEALDSVPLRIDTLDKKLLGPTRKELMVLIAAAKRGKSWFLIHAGKQAYLQRWKVLHVTLEMSEQRTGVRYLQSIVGLTRRDAMRIHQRVFVKDDLGRLIHVDVEDAGIRPGLLEPDGQKLIKKKMKELRGLDRLMIKAFPTGSLTVSSFKAYLDALERTQKFIPDCIIMDYPDLMKISSNEYRLELGNVYKDLRGVAVERNCAMVTATQANREGADSKLVTDTHVAEDWSKIAISDCVLTYSQTLDERKLGLARLFVSNARNEEDKFGVLLSQQYSTGQFVIDSARMPDDYWGIVESEVRRSSGQQPDEESE